MFEFCHFRFGPYGTPSFVREGGIFEDGMELTAFSKDKTLPAFRSLTPEVFPIDEGPELLDSFFFCGKKWWYFYQIVEDSSVGRVYRTSEIYRSVGYIPVNWSDGSGFLICVECQPFSKESLDNLFLAFKSNLMGMILSTSNPSSVGQRLIKCDSNGTLYDECVFEELISSMELLTSRLKSRLTIKDDFVDVEKNRMTAATLLRKLKSPNSKTVLGRVVSRSWNTGENRFLHKTVLRALKLVDLTEELLEVNSDCRILETRDREALSQYRERLNRCRSVFERKEISSSVVDFNFIVFQNDYYYSRFYKIQKAFFSSLLKLDGLSYLISSIKRMNVTHLSQVYERWCLVGLIRILKDVYGFVPEKGWVDGFVKDIVADEYNVFVMFRHPEFRYEIKLTYECEFLKYKNGRPYRPRPDFVLELNDPKFSMRKFPKLVLDAKFRTIFGPIDCRNKLEELVYDKQYGEDGLNHVYLLYPTSEEVRPSYFGLMNGHKGWIHAFPDDGEDFKKTGLVDVILEWLQTIEYENDHEDLDQKLCPSCGSSGKEYLEQSVIECDYKGSPIKWKLECRRCGCKRIQTYCHQCGHKPIFLNGGSSYFRFGLTKFACPECGEPLDR